MPFSCLLIGQDNLLIHCASLLLEKQHEIQWVVSTVPAIQTWCTKHQIRCVDSMQTVIEAGQSVDYLFSIVNGKILKEQDLQIARLGAFNYHDSLLPKYAGVHATSWAMIHDEPSHGITWHAITAGIDAGDVVYQAQFPINALDTALTLNLKCFEEAIKGFAQVIYLLETSALKPQKQSLTDRSYFGPHLAIPNLGFIDWQTMDGQSIERLSRALNFGNYDNNMGTLKLYFNQDYLVVLEAELVETLHADSLAGQILSVTAEGLLVATLTKPILIKKMINRAGELFAIQDLDLSVGQKFPTVDTQWLQNNILAYEQALKHEKYWSSQWLRAAEHSTFSERVIDRDMNYCALPAIAFPNPEFSQSTTYFLAAVLLYLFRTNDYQHPTVFIDARNERNSIPLFEQFLPTTAEWGCEISGSELLELISLDQLNKEVRSRLLTDVCLRHPALTDLAQAQLISIGFTQNDSQMPATAMLHFAIDQDKKELVISHRISSHYQGGLLLPLLENMSQHIGNILKFLINQPNKPIHQFSFLTESEKTKLMNWGVGQYIPLPSHAN